jgi:hypothetical protein
MTCNDPRREIDLPDEHGVSPAAAEEPSPASPSPRRDYADPLRDGAAAAFLYSTMTGFFLNVDVASYKALRDRLIADCGDPDDPIEIMLIEQLMLAHFNTGRLHYRAATANQLDEARAYAGAAVNLASEFRRGALALKAYREPSRSLEVPSVPHAVADDQDGLPEKKAVGQRTGT